MATNKHATIRYHALDQCFSNPGRRYYIDDLIDACNAAIYDYTGTNEGVKRRQVFDDIKFMESEQGWSIPLERIKDGRKVYYRYTDCKFSIRSQAINEQEANQLKETLLILNRFKGMPQFEWMEELLIRIESEFNINEAENPIVGFEQNPYLKGLNFFSDLYNAVNYKRVLKIDYQGFKQEKPVSLIIHPYYLKQYNNRWFLFGYGEEYATISNLAIDRIIKIEEIKKTFIENRSIDFEEYFEDVVGVTIKNDEPVKVVLKISNELYPYIESKPIHGSQKPKERLEDGIMVELEVVVNYELISTIFSLGEGITIMEPKPLRNIIISKAKSLLDNYK